MEVKGNMSVFDLILSRRTIRQFKSIPIPREILERLVDAARVAPSASNLQPLEFIVVDDKDVREKMFPCLKWAAYIAPEGNPKPGQEPMAYIAVLVNADIRKQNFEWDVGAAIENMILAALEKGIGSCWLVSIDGEKISGILNVPSSYKIDAVLALGYPAETPVADEIEDSVKYWKDDKGQLHVPKRRLKDVIHYNNF
jgi:nitroreductase